MALLNIIKNQQQQFVGQGESLALYSEKVAAQARRFHQQFTDYHLTPLHSLNALSTQLGLGQILVKDESLRFNLNAFKALGGSYALGHYLAEKLCLDINELRFNSLAKRLKDAGLDKQIFVTATDGNHGRGIAWAAEQLGLQAVVLMPAGSCPERVANIRRHGAQCIVTEMNYDETVQLANRYAQEHGWVLLQDTAWEGYEEIPLRIMQGYLTLASELSEQLDAQNVMPTHLILQAGVGSFAASMMGYFKYCYPANAPKIIVVEPHQANCLYLSAQRADGAPHHVDGELATLMAGLACGVPNSLCWPVIRDNTDYFLSADDRLAANGMRIAAAPKKGGDPQFTSGESGAIGLGVLYQLMRDESLAAWREEMGLNASARVLMISTEGDTSPARYEEIVWQGKSSIEAMA